MRSLIALLLALPITVSAQQTRADVQCTPTGKELIYDCVIRLSRNDQPLTGAQVSVGADMPSMPMAHNLKPVKARPGKAAGQYLARLDLEMRGEWALKLRISGPVRDQIVKNLRFD
jgi:hypothetical protein